MRFSSNVSLVEDFTGDRQLLRRAIGRLYPGGSTALYEAIAEGLQHLQAGKHKKKALLLITDGNDTSSTVTLKEAVATAQQSEAIIYALGIGHGERGSFGHLLGIFKDTVDVDALRQVTSVACGRTFLLQGEHHKNGVDRIDQTCQQVGAELRMQYSLGYYPKNKAKDGTYRRVKITVKNPRYMVRARAGYFVTVFGQPARDAETEVRNVISRFEMALQQHDLQAIEELVSPDIVVFENGHRNDGWQDFRDHHLLPEFKVSSTPYRTEMVRIEATASLAWGYSRMNRAYIPKKDDTPDVWTVYVLRRSDTGWKVTMLDWSVRRVE